MRSSYGVTPRLRDHPRVELVTRPATVKSMRARFTSSRPSPADAQIAEYASKERCVKRLPRGGDRWQCIDNRGLPQPAFRDNVASASTSRGPASSRGIAPVSNDLSRRCSSSKHPTDIEASTAPGTAPEVPRPPAIATGRGVGRSRRRWLRRSAAISRLRVRKRHFARAGRWRPLKMRAPPLACCTEVRDDTPGRG